MTIGKRTSTLLLCCLLGLLGLGGCGPKVTSPADTGLFLECQVLEGSIRMRMEGNSTVRADFFVDRMHGKSTLHLLGAFGQRMATLQLDPTEILMVDHQQQTYTYQTYAELCQNMNICFGGSEFSSLLCGDFLTTRKFLLGSYTCHRKNYASSEFYTCTHPEQPEVSLRVLGRQCRSGTYLSYSIPAGYEEVFLLR